MTITLTDKAVLKIETMRREKHPDEPYFRIAIEAGGCQGLSYKFSFEKIAHEKDKSIVFDNFVLIIDPKSFLYLDGMQLDWMQSLKEQRFNITLPVKTSNCSCGSSFTILGESDDAR